MRGEVVFRVYAMHTGRPEDMCFGTFRTRAEAEAEIAELAASKMHGESWAARYHDRGFEIREHVVDVDFEPPPPPRPRDRYALKVEPISQPEAWPRVRVEVFRREGAGLGPRLAAYDRGYGMLQTFEPFRQGGRELALVSRDYTRTAVLDLQTGQVIAEEPADPAGFCPVGFYVPDWWDVNDGSIIPGSDVWNADCEWPSGDFGFVWGCVWGDDTSWKVQYLDLRRAQEGVIARDDRFGYVPIATPGYKSPCFRASPPDQPTSPPFIKVWREHGRTRVRFAVEVAFDLASGSVDEEARAALGKPGSFAE